MKINLIVIALFLLVSIGFTFMLTLSTFYQSEDSTDSKFSVLDGLLSGELKRTEDDNRKIIEDVKSNLHYRDPQKEAQFYFHLYFQQDYK